MTPIADRLRAVSDELASIADVYAALEAERDYYRNKCLILTAEIERQSERVEVFETLPVG